ncbi:hypothetical protein BDN72DRAFT_824554 [Pluteus cervinus]|uniref:Uncharacterized protein n=1 Tax=Pluteus cervinus TaxID=181527 RepID=A0ACD3AIE5_9AGAR|nr:hypothetical protein BDN72DRAFT_824554 [Pluteus cervinus]
MDPPSLGTIVDVQQFGRGVVRFAGPTSFSAGKWVGVELDEPKGKNDGSVQGTQYFTSRVGHGVFVRPSQIKATFGSELDRPPPPSAPIARPAGHQRTGSTSLLRTNSNSFRSSPSSNGSPRAASPVKLPGASPAPSPRIQRLGAPSPTKRLPQLGLQQPRRSFSSRQPPGQDSVPPSPSPRIGEATTVVQKAIPSTIVPGLRRTSSPLTLPPQDATPPPPLPLILPTDTPAPASSLLLPPVSPEIPKSSPPPPSPTSLNLASLRAQDEEEIKELKAKIRVLEAKRADDSRHVRELENRLSEAEAFVALRPKLQAKLNQQQTELIATRRELADSQQISQLAETRILDSQEQLEMAMLDKEVAEEKAEIAEAELDELKEKLAVMEVELEVVKSGGAPSGEGGSGGKDTLAYIQLEKQNERLKEALIKLRDITQDNDQEQRRRINDMEKDLSNFDEIQTQYETTLIMMSNAQTEISDLKAQLDDAMSAEDMLVQLTERNLVLGEKIEEMRITIEDLEALKELNDELEENHMETEKMLHDDIEQRDTQIREQTNRIMELENLCQEFESTVTQFRDFVAQQQNEVEALRSQTETAQNESAAAASQAASIMSMNMKLQSTASKNQARHVELEVKKIEARETKELLGIVQPYLPQLYIESDSDATSCYLFFQRIALKADVINTVVAQAHGLPDALMNASVPEILVGVCEMRGRISNLSTLCKRFSAVLRRCDVDFFLNMGRVYPEIAPMEKRLDMHIDLLRRDEFREKECVNDIAKMQVQLDHLAETYFDGYEHDLAERELGYMLAFDYELDIFAAAIGLNKTVISALLSEEEVTPDYGGYDINAELFDPLQKLLDQYKTAKATSKKLCKRVEELAQDSIAIKAHLIPQMKALGNYVTELVNFGIQLAQEVIPNLSDVRSAKTPFQLTTILGFVKQTASSTIAKDLKPGGSVWEAIGAFITQLIQDANKLLPQIMESEQLFKVTGTAPWTARVQDIKNSLAVNVEAERKVAQLGDEMQGLVRNLKSKDQTIQESTVKIELMERRMEAVKKQADTIVDLENELTKARKQERAYEEAMEQLQADLDTLEQDNAKLKNLAAGQERQAIGPQPVETENVPVEGSLETSYLLEQIEALRGTVRFLRTENSYLKGQDLLREIEALPPLPRPITREPTPPLIPSGQSDTDDSDSETPPTPPTFRALATETKLLYRDVIKFSSSPRVVDLSALNAKRAEGKGGKIWLPRKQMPAHQVLERKLEGERLNRRVKTLMERANAIGRESFV